MKYHSNHSFGDFNSKPIRDKHFVNEAIKLNKIICIDQNNKNLGPMYTKEALKLAFDSGLDLVQVNPPTKDNFATCKIMNFSKWKYENSKKAKELAKKQKEQMVKIKEIKLRPTTGLHDLELKAKHCDQFLEDGHKVQISFMFKGREAMNVDVAILTLQKFLELTTKAALENPDQSLDEFKSNPKSFSLFLVKAK